MNSVGVKWAKNVLILILTVLVVYQTGRLWFGGVPNLDFMYILGIEQRPEGLSDAMKGLSVPKRVLASEGGNVFIANYSQIEKTEQFRSARAVITEFLGHGTHAGFFTDCGESGANFTALVTDILTGAALVLDYGFSMPAETFAVVFGGNPALLTYYTDFFDKVVLAPQPHSHGGAKVVFLDTLSENQSAHQFTVETAEQIVYGDMRNRLNLFYFASIPASLDFARLVFLPQSLDGGISYRQIRWADSILTTPAIIQRVMLGFFDNPTIVRGDVLDNNVFFFRDNYTTAVYRGWQYIEYSSWRIRGSRSTETLQEAFAEAILFMERDEALVNEVFLYRFEYDGGVWRLFFNYIFDDLPVIMDEVLRRELGDMQSFIEVTVQRGRVTHYKRFDVHVDARGEGGRLFINHHNALRGLELYDSYRSIKSVDLVFTLGMLTSTNLSYSVRTVDSDRIIFTVD